jgi:hypothetical protein
VEALHDRYHAVLDEVRSLVPPGTKQHVVDRAFLPQFTFGETDLVLTVGPDGLVVNTAKYLDGQPIVAVNPDPERIEGVLLPFTTRTLGAALSRTLYQAPVISPITMAQASMNDGQTLLPFNDLIIGARSHVSARYRLQAGKQGEDQSSSGIIISTGAGSTGWLKSVYAGAAKVIEALGGEVHPPSNGGQFPWDAEQLIYAVREPWPSKSTGANLVYGVITRDQPLVITSHMAENGVIFSDGIENDYLAFNAGRAATIRIADKKVNLVTNA